MPIQSSTNDCAEIRVLWLPFQNAGCGAGVGNEFGRVAWPALSIPADVLDTRRALDRTHHVANRVSAARSEIEGPALPVLQEIFQRANVRFR